MNVVSVTTSIENEKNNGQVFLIAMISVLMLNTGCSQKVVGTKDKKQFAYHFAILDSVASVTPHDTLVNVTESIAFMERKTNIEASTDGTLVGRLACTKEDLKRWHEWYNLSLNKRGKNK